MRIAINTRLLLPGKMDGIGWFTYETTRRMVAAHPDHQFILLFDRRPAGLDELLAAPNVQPVVLCPQARHPVLWWMFFELSVPTALKRYKADLYLSPDGMMPLRPKVPTLNVIHDLNFEHADGNLKPSHQRYMTHFFPRFARAASRLATVSEYSRQDIAATYGIDAERIDVVYDGAHSHYRPHSDEEKKATRQRFTYGAPYIIFISTILKRKNLANLLKAFDKVKDSIPTLKLVVVGSRAWWQDELKKAYDTMRHRDDIIMLGHADPDDLAALLSASEMLVYPSYFEGFGIPILEAMYAETAVVCSRTTSMPEVGGDAALYVDPSSPDDIANAIVQASDPATSEAMIARGRTQRTLFSWDRTADLLWQSIMKLER
ncbi:MAG: glycosyltransferase family 4 protein [Bacteroidales bacterium]|nr:glycosyltransferase family 4 protein [Bacteroidales bacterium]